MNWDKGVMMDGIEAYQQDTIQGDALELRTRLSRLNLKLLKNRETLSGGALKEVNDLLKDAEAIAEEMNGLKPPVRVNYVWPAEGQNWEKPSWLWPGFIPDGEVTLLAGMGAVGKTSIVMQLATAYATGRRENPFLWESRLANRVNGPELTGEGKVYWASWETREGNFQHRLEKAARGFDIADLSGRLAFDNERPAGPLWGVDKGVNHNNRPQLLPAGQALLNRAVEFGAGLLVLDPLAGVYGANENDRSNVREFLAYLGQWATDNNCAVLILAHPPKTGSESYSGSTDWENGVQSRLTLTACGAECCKGDADRKYRFLESAKLNEGGRPRKLAFVWDDVLETMALTHHHTPQKTNSKQGGRARRKENGDRPEMENRPPWEQDGV